MEGYTKLFRGITKSTVWSLDNDHKAVWVFLLAEADQHGNVVCTVPGLAKANDVSVEKAATIIRCFMSPDPYSGSKDYEGRRIVEIDRGWHVLNHAKYRALRSKEDKAEYDRVYAANRRLEEKIAKLEGKKANRNEGVVNSSKQSAVVGEVVQANTSASASGRVSKVAANQPAAIPRSPVNALMEGYPQFGPTAFRTLFDFWPGAGKFDEDPALAETAFNKYITSENYGPFCLALETRLSDFSKDRDPNRRKDLGTFRTFCEERWERVKQPAAAPSGQPLETFVPTPDRPTPSIKVEVFEE